MDPLISVVAPTFRRPDRLRRLVAALEAQDLDRDAFEVLVVDNGSGDETTDVLTELAGSAAIDLRPQRIEINRGPAPARNLGWQAARGRYVAFIDDDCVPEPGWLRGLLHAFERNPALGVVQGLVRRPDGPVGRWTIFREVTWESPWFEACNIAYRRELLDVTGGFDEGIGWYGEDTSAGWKVVEAGGERDFATDAAVTHDLEERGLRWRIRHGWLEANLVALAARHPGLRSSGFWRPWAFRRENAAFGLAVVGLVAGLRDPRALALAVPYVVLRRLPTRSPRFAAELVAVDAAQLVGHLSASLKHRVFVL